MKTKLALIGVAFLPLVLLFGSMIFLNYHFGVHGFGPEHKEQITVQRLYVDSGESSHYIVGTDKGVFEIDNIIIPIQIFNGDELFSKLEIGKTYNVKTKGNKVLNWFYQQYPYIIEIE